MNRSKKILGLLEQGKEMELSDDAQKKLSPEEQATAKKFMIKGYKHAIQLELDGELFGEPMYFKTAEQVGPFMRSTAGGKLKQKWVVNL